MSLLLDALQKKHVGETPASGDSLMSHASLGGDLSLEPLDLRHGASRLAEGEARLNPEKANFPNAVVGAASADLSGRGGVGMALAVGEGHESGLSGALGESAQHVRKWWQGQLGARRGGLTTSVLYAVPVILLAGGGLIAWWGWSEGWSRWNSGTLPTDGRQPQTSQPSALSSSSAVLSAGDGSDSGLGVSGSASAVGSSASAASEVASTTSQQTSLSTQPERSSASRPVRHDDGPAPLMSANLLAKNSEDSRVVSAVAATSVGKVVDQTKGNLSGSPRLQTFKKGTAVNEEGIEKSSVPARSARTEDRPRGNSSAAESPLLKIEPDPVNRLRSQAEAALLWGDWIEAERAYSDWLRLRPDEPAALAGLALALHRQQRWADAWQAYQRAAQRWPENLSLRSGALAVLARLDPMLAESRLRDWLADHPDDAMAYATLGALLARQQRWAQSLEFLQKAVSLAPDDATYHYNLALVLDQMQRVESAIHHYRRSLASGDPAIPRTQVEDRIRTLLRTVTREVQ